MTSAITEHTLHNYIALNYSSIYSEMSIAVQVIPVWPFISLEIVGHMQGKS